MIVILLNGYPLSGKDTFIDTAKGLYKCYQHSTIDRYVDIAKGMGWDGYKTDFTRAMLSDLKKWAVKYFDAPFSDLTNCILDMRDAGEIDIFITVSREGEEIQRIKNWCKYKRIRFVYVIIDRQTGRDYGNSSDNNVLDGITPNIYINNDDSLQYFEKMVLECLKMLMK